ncbi:MAG: aminotransferase class V-fold PLP-dependent enzyme [Gammaproteobacteria bacterium]|nr:aminotransferase class V-fold PLP-dependent enzyme [Gammaproteobacteria bacterium]
MNFDINFARKQFLPFIDDTDFVFCSNAGGSYVARQVNKIFERYNRHMRVQPYSGYSPSREAGGAMDRAHSLWSEALDVSPDELTFGPSTSMNTYVLAQAIGPTLKSGDQIIVTSQDHESNRGVWLRMAKQREIEVRHWNVEPELGLLDVRSLDNLLTEKTRWIFFTHCSNLVGTVNPVQDCVNRVRVSSDARVFIDAVSYAPHHIPSPKSLGVDGYAFSLYKVFGPHQGIMYLDRQTSETMEAQCHDFNVGTLAKHFNPAGPLHAEVAASAGVLDYFEDLHKHHFGQSNQNLRAKLDDLHTLTGAHETHLARTVLDCLNECPDVRVLGKQTVENNDRVCTVAFKHSQRASSEICADLQNLGIGCESGSFYANHLVEDFGVDPKDGFVRISLVHYNSQDELDRIVSALQQILG